MNSIVCVWLGVLQLTMNYISSEQPINLIAFLHSQYHTLFISRFLKLMFIDLDNTTRLTYFCVVAWPPEIQTVYMNLDYNLET